MMNIDNPHAVKLYDIATVLVKAGAIFKSAMFNNTKGRINMKYFAVKPKGSVVKDLKIKYEIISNEIESWTLYKDNKVLFIANDSEQLLNFINVRGNTLIDAFPDFLNLVLSLERTFKNCIDDDFHIETKWSNNHTVDFFCESTNYKGHMTDRPYVMVTISYTPLIGFSIGVSCRGTRLITGNVKQAIEYFKDAYADINPKNKVKEH